MNTGRRTERETVMTSATKPVVIVGVSESKASAEALRWAAEEADRRHARLQIVRSWSPQFDAPYAPVDINDPPEQQHEAASRNLSALLRETFGPRLPDWITAELTDGIAERLLVDRSASADLLVLGSATPPLARARPVGPVVRACLSRARCPVVVVSPAGRPVSPPVASDGQSDAPTSQPELIPAP
jgi:nucleotide-binding universal stress UspA family protein